MDTALAAFSRELEMVLARLTAEVRRLIRQLDVSPAGRLESTQRNLRRALRLRQDLLKALDQMGYRQVVLRATDAPLDQLARQILRADQVAIARPTVEMVAALKEIRAADLFQVGAEIAQQLWRTVVDGVLGVRPVVDLVDDIADLLDISARRARTVYDTAVSTFSRQVGQLGTTGEPDELFFYVGPVDDRVREFCLERVGKVFTRDEIDDMDNGQLPNVMLTGGGYNCRHQFRRVSALDQELIDLAGTGRRHGPVQERLDEVAA